MSSTEVGRCDDASGVATHRPLAGRTRRERTVPFFLCQSRLGRTSFCACSVLNFVLYCGTSTPIHCRYNRKVRRRALYAKPANTSRLYNTLINAKRNHLTPFSHLFKYWVLFLDWSHFSCQVIVFGKCQHAMIGLNQYPYYIYTVHCNIGRSIKICHL